MLSFKKTYKWEFNTDKCYAMSYTLFKKPLTFDYSVSQIVLARKVQIRDLGVWFDVSPKFGNHITIEVNESYRILGFIKRSCHCEFVLNMYLITLRFINDK